MGVSDMDDLGRLDMILYDRPAGRSIVGHAIATIQGLRAEHATATLALREAQDTIRYLSLFEGSEERLAVKRERDELLALFASIADMPCPTPRQWADIREKAAEVGAALAARQDRGAT